MRHDIDAGLTSIENARRRIAALAAQYPQTRFAPPTCTDETPHWGPLAEDWVKDVGMVKTLGPIQSKTCSHGASVHNGDSGVKISDVHPIAGRRNKAGAFVMPGWKPPTTTGNLPKRIAENIAACRAVGLSYWCEGRGTVDLWAVDDQQRAHEVMIDRKTGKAEHRCYQNYRYEPAAPNAAGAYVGGNVRDKQRCERPVDGIQRWTLPTTTELFEIGDHDDEGLSGQESRTGTDGAEPGDDVPRGQAPGSGAQAPGPFNPFRPRQADHHDEGDDVMANSLKLRSKPPTLAEKRAVAAKKAEQKKTVQRLTPPRPPSVYDANAEKPMSRAQALALLAHDPDYLGDITNAALVDLLDEPSVKKHHPAIRRELKNNRGLTPKKAI